MKFFRKKFSLLAVLVSLLALQSCSWMNKRKVLFDQEGSSSSKTEQATSSQQTVSKAQYDQLLSKYEQLLDKIKHAETTTTSQRKSPTSGEGGHAHQLEMMNELSKITPPADLAETVDVFGKNGMAQVSTTETPASNSKMSDSAIQAQLGALQKANRLVTQNKMDSALILLKDLEESKNKQIRVRAKFYLAEMLFRQNEYDLAMQMYEEIIKKYAFSGLVIKSLGRLIVCSSKLKLGKKQERYYSMLHDFFESA